ETTIENTPLAYQNSSFSGNSTDLNTLNYLNSNAGAVMSLSEQVKIPEESTTEFITEPTTEPITELTGIIISDFSLVKTPDKTIYTIGEEIDLTGGVIHDSIIITNQNGEQELIDSYQYMTSENYILESEAFDNTKAGIYPIYLVKNYININNQPATEKILFYVLVKEPQIIQDITDPTELPTTEPETEFTTTESTTETNIFHTDPTETNIQFTLPTFSEQQFTFPTMPTGNNSNNNFDSDLIQQYLQSQIGQNSGSNFNSDMMQQYLQSQIGQNSGSNFNSDMMQQYLQSQNGMGTNSNSTNGLSQQELASIYASMMNGGNTGNLSQQDLASMYTSMQGNQTIPATTDNSGNLSQQDLASMYLAMQGNQTTTETNNTFSQEELAEIYSAMQNGQTTDFSGYNPYSNFSSEDIQKMMNISNMSETESAQALDNYMQNPNEDILLEIYEQYISSGNYDSNMNTFGVVSLDAPSSINIYVDSFEAKESIADCIANYNKTVSEENQISYTDYIGLLMSSVTTIVNVISYVLIAFVAVSLIVSSIMIGIITYISVLERTKEIGILRAIGASKHNISQVFNAETFIIGLCSGAIGVGITKLLLIPANIIIHAIADSNSVNASLPITASIILIIISVILTLIGGFIPAKKASTKDAVV
ncbi:MAG: ABC transporter permease, partial [Oscillospiraceae bacterium]|nr:ABC transporter permease [Oscillospiraceae bacterium]